MMANVLLAMVVLNTFKFMLMTIMLATSGIMSTGCRAIAGISKSWSSVPIVQVYIVHICIFA